MPLEVNISVRGIAGDITDTFGNIRTQSARQPLPRRRPREYVDSSDYQRCDLHEQGVPIEFFDRPAPRRPRTAQRDEVIGQGHSVRSRTSSSRGSHYRPEDEGEASDVHAVGCVARTAYTWRTRLRQRHVRRWWFWRRGGIWFLCGSGTCRSCTASLIRHCPCLRFWESMYLPVQDHSFQPGIVLVCRLRGSVTGLHLPRRMLCSRTSSK